MRDALVSLDRENFGLEMVYNILGNEEKTRRILYLLSLSLNIFYFRKIIVQL